MLGTNILAAQVAIGKTQVTNSSVSLEFGSQNRGVLLPWITSITSLIDAPNGTICFDLSDNRIKIKYAVGWMDFSQNDLGTTIDPVTSIDGALLQNSLNENTSSKTSIGNVSNANGILVLEDNNKAMILPKVASPHYNIVNPAPGMIVYDTDSKLIAFFNGKVWSYWK